MEIVLDRTILVLEPNSWKGSHCICWGRPAYCLPGDGGGWCGGHEANELGKRDRPDVSGGVSMVARLQIHQAQVSKFGRTAQPPSSLQFLAFVDQELLNYYPLNAQHYHTTAWSTPHEPMGEIPSSFLTSFIRV